MLIDLQLHSTYSDGYLTPTEAAKFAADQGVKVAALTDHNTVGGTYEFKEACKRFKIKPVTGMELYIKYHNYRFNMLWYNFDDKSPELHDVLRDSQRRRRKRMRTILERLAGLGFDLDPDKIIDKYNHYVPINRVVDELIANSKNFERIKRELGLVSPREGDIIKEYFSNQKIGKLKNSFIDLDRILKLRKRIGGQLVLCHPAKSAYIDFKFVSLLKQAGVEGIEVLSPHHSYDAVVYTQHLAAELDFFETGGSDFHRYDGGRNPVQHSWQYYRIDSDLLKGVKMVIG